MFRIIGVIMLFGLVSCADPKINKVGGFTVTSVTAETTNDIAACGMGVESSTALKAGGNIVANGGTVDLVLKDELKSAFVSKFGEKDALAASEKYLACMKERSDDRKADKKTSELSSCKTAWTCNTNAVAGICACSQVIEKSQKKYGWSDAKKGAEYAKLCLEPAKIQQCWPAGEELKKVRARCETVLGDANLTLPELDGETCAVTPIKPLI